MAWRGGRRHVVAEGEVAGCGLEGRWGANGELRSSRPRERTQAGTTEALNWVAVAGAMEGIPMESISYEPGYRTNAGTGCGGPAGVGETGRPGRGRRV